MCPDKNKNITSLLFRSNISREEEKDYICTLIEELLIYQSEFDVQMEKTDETHPDEKKTYLCYKELYDFLSLGYFSLTEEGVITSANLIGARFLGKSSSQLIGSTLLEYISPTSYLNFVDYFSKLSTLRTQTCGIKLVNKSGRITAAEISAKITTNPCTLKQEIRVTMYNVDMGNNKEVIHSEFADDLYVDYLGKFRRMMAEKIPPTLAAVEKYIYNMSVFLKKGNLSVNLLDLITHKIFTALKPSFAFIPIPISAIKGVIQNDLVNIETVINESIILIRDEQSEYPIKIIFKTLKNVSSVACNPSEMQQVILNLLRNSIEAMKSANTFHPTIVIELEKINSVEVEICVYDNGPGVILGIAHRLFSPNFTTKDYGVGLGLSISKTILEASNGKLIYDSNVAYGACFKITLTI